MISLIQPLPLIYRSGMCFGLEETETCKMCGMSSEVEGKVRGGCQRLGFLPLAAPRRPALWCWADLFPFGPSVSPCRSYLRPCVGRLTSHSCCVPSELAGDLSPCPLGPGLRVTEIARTEGKNAVEGLLLVISGPRGDVCHVLSQFIG